MWHERFIKTPALPRVDPRQRATANEQTLTFTQSEVEALWLCVMTAQTPAHPTTTAVMDQAYSALRRESRGPR